ARIQSCLNRGASLGIGRSAQVEVPILKQGAFLIATFQAALSDADLNQLRMGLVQQVVKFRSRAVIVDVTAMDVMDSFASRTLREIALMIRLRGAETVIVGIQPEVAFAMVQLGLTLEGVATALALEEGLAYLISKFKSTNWRCATGPVGEFRVAINSSQDIVLARQKGRAMAIELGFSSGDATLIATAISELARNIISYAGQGPIALPPLQTSSRTGMLIIASDHGPGIPDI